MLSVFSDLRIEGDPARLTQLVEMMSTRPAPGWQRDMEYEKARREDLRVAGRPYFVFRWSGDSARPSAILFLFQDDGTLRVTNIVPVGIRELDRTAYNSILQDFAARQVTPMAHEMGLQVEVTAERLHLIDWLTEEAASRLAQFSAQANRTGMHPIDRKRWQRFLVQVHRDELRTGHRLDPDLLERWLVEEEGWPKGPAEELVAEFEDARSLLIEYDHAH